MRRSGRSRPSWVRIGWLSHGSIRGEGGHTPSSRPPTSAGRTSGAVAERSSRAAVLGRPIAHSLSPVLHRAAYAELGLDWTYTAIDCGVDELPGVLAERADWAGFSCTMPLKRALLTIADEIRPVARAVRAANTLLPRPDGGWIADDCPPEVCAPGAGREKPNAAGKN